MSEPKLISPMLDNFVMGDPISNHNGVQCCPAMQNDTEEKYLVKIISLPAFQTQLDALLLSGAYNDKESALDYYKALAADILEEANILQKLAQLEGFASLEKSQMVPMDDETGYDVYLLSKYRNTLAQQLRKNALTQLSAVNLGLDLCSALTVCRKSGYLYVNLKPENIYLSENQEYQIGDIGFLKLDTLKYTSLPERYFSKYTAPEITDAFSALNSTLDVYAVGLILYQIFNNGALPVIDNSESPNDFPAPEYADQEIAEIILKACSANPADRWQSPVEMGQALVGYMQRIGANDVPIVPISEEPVSEDDGLRDGSAEESAQVEDVSVVVEGEPESGVYVEDEDGNLTFIADYSNEAHDLAETSEGTDYDEVSDEVSDMLTQADEIIAHPAPDPVVQPEAIDVPIPPPLPIEEDETDDTGDNTEQTSEDEDAKESADDDEASDEAAQSEQDSKKKPSHLLRYILIALVSLSVIAAGIFFYTNYYLQSIDSIILKQGDNGSLTVIVKTEFDEDKLTVLCSDTYGNQLTASVKDGRADFTELKPNTAYNIKIVTDSFHKLIGNTTAAYSTPAQTNIIQFNAVTGSEDGSAIISFNINGPDAKNWSIQYSAEGEAAKSISFTGHMITVTGLTVGKEYTFTLIPESTLLISGTTEIKHTASKLIKATDLAVKSILNNTLTVLWRAPEGVQVNSWSVRCYNESGFDKTQVVNECNAVFEGVDQASAYTIEVTANGMSVSERTNVAANAITITEFKVDNTNLNKLIVSWSANNTASLGGWVLSYKLDDAAAIVIDCGDATSYELHTKIPGITYTFVLKSKDGTDVLGGTLVHQEPPAKDFSAYNVSAANMEFKMCKTPSVKNWDRYDLKKSDYTSTFTVGGKASFLIHLQGKYSKSSDKIIAVFLIRDENGMIASTSGASFTWSKMWSGNYCELNIPVLPQVPGNYKISVYFNEGFVHEQQFTIAT